MNLGKWYTPCREKESRFFLDEGNDEGNQNLGWWTFNAAFVLQFAAHCLQG